MKKIFISLHSAITAWRERRKAAKAKRNKPWICGTPWVKEEEDK